MKFRLLITGALALFLGVAAHAKENAVTRWNAITCEVFARTQGTNPMVQSRTFAILQASVHDALNAIDPRFAAYTPGLRTAPEASIDAAVAAASRDVLVTLLPDDAARIEAEYTRFLDALPDDAAKAAGISTGQAAARATLQRRNGDGLEQAAVPYVPRSGVGEYQFTAPFDFAAAPRWGGVKPFVIDAGRHGVRAPYALTSAEYARDVEHIRALGRIDSTTRTPEQSEIAKFWYEDSPLGWNRIVNSVIRERELDPWTSARALALVNFAMADGFIAGFDAKYRYRFWRPMTAIRAAADDGNPRTEPDASWEPLLPTPPVPDHPSTHTVLGWAAAEVLIALFGDRAQYSVTSLTLPGVTRQYTTFSAAAEENGMSRLYAGIHFRHAVEDGKSQGRGIGRAVARALAPVAPRLARR